MVEPIVSEAPKVVKFTCPRRVEDGMDSAESPFRHAGKDLDFWNPKDGTCTYCGSMNPDYFMARLAAGDVEITPTDKDYKAYLQNTTGEKFKTTHRTDDLPWEGWDSPNHHFETTESSQGKFYYQHLSTDQRKLFVEMLNGKKMRIDYPGYFYRLPFFLSR